jgi:hypothetical protein
VIKIESYFGLYLLRFNKQYHKSILKRKMAQTFVSFPCGFQSGVYCPPKIFTVDPLKGSFVGTAEDHIRHIKVDIDPDLMKYVIGTRGYYFNAITRASGVSYIWYDKNTETIEVHGPIWRLDDAERRLTERMDHIQWANILKTYKIDVWADEAE